MNDIQIQISPAGKMKVWVDECCCFPGTVSERERLKRWIGGQVGLDPMRKLAIQGEIDCAVNRWLKVHPQEAPETESISSELVAEGRGCFGVSIALLLVAPLAAWIGVILWCWNN